MLLSKLNQKPLSLILRNILILGLLQFFFFLGLECTPLKTQAALAYSPVSSNAASVDADRSNNLDADRAATQADKASEEIFKGLDTTKEIIGKTDRRKQVIEQAREQASDKLKSLANKAKESSDPDQDLSPNEKLILERLQDTE